MAINVKVSIPVAVTTLGQYDKEEVQETFKEVSLSAKREIIIGDYRMGLEDLQDVLEFLTKDDKPATVYRGGAQCS